MATELATRYDASSCESTWYARWEAAGLFSPGYAPEKGDYCITIPPPNITGSLHMGHALCYPIQDALGRYQRLRGTYIHVNLLTSFDLLVSILISILLRFLNGTTNTCIVGCIGTSGISERETGAGRLVEQSVERVFQAKPTSYEEPDY
jgi:hypothetical protein